MVVVKEKMDARRIKDDGGSGVQQVEVQFEWQDAHECKFSMQRKTISPMLEEHPQKHQGQHKMWHHQRVQIVLHMNGQLMQRISFQTKHA